ncbi:hypothetical protein VTP01DRAFT_6332 [Rhizomucor pusillus]|uniref:uncharacterized protein n=1 Tax=Rhizomucor pusillus TaxID=4840 RepID=UPI003744830D
MMSGTQAVSPALRPGTFGNVYTWLLETIRKLLFDRSYFWHLAVILLIGEMVLNAIIIQKVSYTEIDWVAYMQEVKGFIDGERDYLKLRGDTGPLVYPAGFVYLYSLLYFLTDDGQNVRLAQYIFGILYVVTHLVVFAIYRKSKLPQYIIVLLCLSKRLHSIYVLRCFNDPVAMIFLYASVLAMVYRKWTLSSVFYSFALSIKMNVLLYFPAFGLLMWQSVGAWKTLFELAVIAGIQICIAFPFLKAFPASYLQRAFEFGRVFDYRWTVNWRMIDAKTFVSTEFANVLLLGHVVILLFFLTFVWSKRDNVIKLFFGGFYNKTYHISADEIISTMFTCNLIGITFARSLHYQFYSWYFHTLPYLLWNSIKGSRRTEWIAILLRLGIFVLIENCWLTFPSTEYSSWALLSCHAVILTMTA